MFPNSADSFMVEDVSFASCEHPDHRHDCGAFHTPSLETQVFSPTMPPVFDDTSWKVASSVTIPPFQPCTPKILPK